MQPRLPVLQVHSQHPQQPQIPHRSAPRPGPACCPSNSPLTPHSPNTSTSSSLTVILNSVRRDRTRDDGKLLSHFSILSAARNLLLPPPSPPSPRPLQLRIFRQDRSGRRHLVRSADSWSAVPSVAPQPVQPPLRPANRRPFRQASREHDAYKMACHPGRSEGSFFPRAPSLCLRASRLEALLCAPPHPLRFKIFCLPLHSCLFLLATRHSKLDALNSPPASNSRLPSGAPRLPPGRSAGNCRSASAFRKSTPNTRLGPSCCTRH